MVGWCSMGTFNDPCSSILDTTVPQSDGIGANISQDVSVFFSVAEQLGTQDIWLSHSPLTYVFHFLLAHIHSIHIPIIFGCDLYSSSFLAKWFCSLGQDPDLWHHIGCSKGQQGFDREPFGQVLRKQAEAQKELEHDDAWVGIDMLVDVGGLWYILCVMCDIIFTCLQHLEPMNKWRNLISTIHSSSLVRKHQCNCSRLQHVLYEVQGVLFPGIFVAPANFDPFGKCKW